MIYHPSDPQVELKVFENWWEAYFRNNKNVDEKKYAYLQTCLFDDFCPWDIEIYKWEIGELVAICEVKKREYPLDSFDLWWIPKPKTAKCISHATDKNVNLLYVQEYAGGMVGHARLYSPGTGMAGGIVDLGTIVGRTDRDDPRDEKQAMLGIPATMFKTYKIRE